jgi:uncharacterized protein (TIGR02118 family)
VITVSVLYPSGEGRTFDLDYYLSKHMPLVIARFGGALRGATVESGIANAAPGQPLHYVAICRLGFDSADAFQAAFAPHSAEIMGDIGNYTNITPIIQLSDVRLSR